MFVQTRDSSTQEVETGGSEIQGHLQLHLRLAWTKPDPQNKTKQTKKKKHKAKAKQKEAPEPMRSLQGLLGEKAMLPTPEAK